MLSMTEEQSHCDRDTEVDEEDNTLLIGGRVHCSSEHTNPTFTSVFCKRAVPREGDQGSSHRQKLEKTRFRAVWQQITEARMGKTRLF
jgi:hypothetical protein